MNIKGYMLDNKRLPVFLLLLLLFASHSIFAQTITVTPGIGNGDSPENAIAIPLETLIAIDRYDVSPIYFTFDAPVNAKYWIQEVVEGRNDIRLYDEKGKEIATGKSIEKKLKIGTYIFELKPERERDFFRISLHVPSDRIPSSSVDQNKARLKAAFAKAPVAELSKDIEIKVEKRSQTNYYRFKVTEAARYQIHVDDDIKEKVRFRLYIDEERMISRAVAEIEGLMVIGLAPGTYYVEVNSDLKPADFDNFTFVIAGEDQPGWNYYPSPLEKFFHDTDVGYLQIILVASAVLFVIIMIFGIYRPYNRYLKRKYDIEFFGLPCMLMLAVFFVFACLDVFLSIERSYWQNVILIASDIVVTTWMCIDHYMKTRKPLLLVFDIILIHIVYAIAITLMVLVVYAVIIIICLIFVGFFAALMLSTLGGGSGTVYKCPRCGRTSSTGGYCNCG